MNYDGELRLLTDTIKKYGVPVTIADPYRPPASELALLLLQKEESAEPLSALLPPIAPATVYTMVNYDCCYTYFLLPDQQPEALLIFGPYLKAPISNEQILEQSDPKQHKNWEKFYTALPILSPSSHLHILLDAFFDRIWGVGSYTSETVSRTSRQDMGLWPDLRMSDQDNALISAAIMEERYAQENGLIEAVKQGQTRKIETFLSRISAGAFEQRVADPVRNVKNYCIITNTLLRKAAEQGGVHPVYIDSISSAFALRIEQLSSPAAGNALIGEMALNYCRLVREHATKGYSAPIQKAIIMIEGNLAGELTLTRLAGELNVNSSYLSALFKKETGMTVTDYIARRRIHHSRHLLKTTRLQVQTVGQLCGFEDVHYFSKVFKRITGLTPKQYRQEHIKE